MFALKGSKLKGLMIRIIVLLLCVCVCVLKNHLESFLLASFLYISSILAFKDILGASY